MTGEIYMHTCVSRVPPTFKRFEAGACIAKMCHFAQTRHCNFSSFEQKKYEISGQNHRVASCFEVACYVR